METKAKIMKLIDEGRSIASKLGSLSFEMNKKYSEFVEKNHESVDLYYSQISFHQQFTDYLKTVFGDYHGNRFHKLEKIENTFILMIDADSGFEHAGDIQFSLTSFLAEFHPDEEIFSIVLKWC
jgi:hypothetical protein